MNGVQSFFSQFNAADMLWLVGAVILGLLAFKVVAKLLKFALVAVVILLLIGFLMSTGIIPSLF